MSNINFLLGDLESLDELECNTLYGERRQIIKSRKDNHISETKRDRLKKRGKFDKKNSKVA